MPTLDEYAYLIGGGKEKDGRDGRRVEEERLKDERTIKKETYYKSLGDRMENKAEWIQERE